MAGSRLAAVRDGWRDTNIYGLLVGGVGGAMSGADGTEAGTKAIRLRHSVMMLGFCAVVAAMITNAVINDGRESEDLRQMRLALAQAGHSQARIQRGQRLSAMSRCDVGQIRKRGAAYEWRTDWASGVYCAPADGRPDRILIDGQEP